MAASSTATPTATEAATAPSLSGVADSSVTAEDAQLGDEFISLTFNESESSEDEDDDDESGEEEEDDESEDSGGGNE